MLMERANIFFRKKKKNGVPWNTWSPTSEDTFVNFILKRLTGVIQCPEQPSKIC